ncbi:seminal metalloprotease 1 [Drosophila mojavensis]|uniref:Metalloendopeptidase n=1 Tax=Drosophila mojavensis TaxID=7230 RepID=B4KLJ0_DROMO|nr:seminal metalloprotease 1 [Drosophila mojavensis]EDW12871.1 uncharacterized protein Dmoj_GI22552 [Drosophila mojavensis]
MFAARPRFVPLLIACLCLGAWGAPVKEQEAEADPELTAGYFQGDMDVEVQRNGEIAPARRWANTTVPYKIDEAFNSEQTEHIKLGMRRIELVSCIRFVPVPPNTLDYVFITVSETGCSSKVGYLGAEQTLKLKPAAVDVGCFRLGTIEHELLHTLGFHHQQCSADRDEYVKIVEENITEGKEGNFKKYEADRVESFDVKYDYGSVLHYNSKAFSKNGEATIVALQPEGELQMGQRLGLSKADILRLNTMYKCPLQV